MAESEFPTVSVSATPLLPESLPTSNQIKYVKQAPIDTIVFDESDLTPEILFELLVESLGGLELANISRSDLVDGQTVSYSVIKNLSSLRRRFDPNNIISSFASLETFFSRFGIDLLKRGVYVPVIDQGTGEIIIEIDRVLPDEEVEVYFVSSGTIEKVRD
jgi:hypothetical protein